MDAAIDLPHTLTYAIMYRAKLDSFYELPKEKRPPRYMWDRPYELGEFLEHVWDTDGKGKSSTNVYEYDLEDVE